MGLMRSTKRNNINKDINNLSNLSTEPDCFRTVLSEIDFAVSGGRTTVQEENKFSHDTISNLDVSSINDIVSDCRVVVDDILLCDQTEKFKALKSSQEKNHSASSRQPIDKIYLESLVKKDPIAWPKMKESEKWNQLDDEVFLLLVGGSTVQERVALLETSIYNKATQLFGHLPPLKKGLRGLNRRAQYSIKLVKEKNTLLGQINICPDEASKASLLDLLNIVRRRLQNFRRGEKSRKRRWKVKQANQSFGKNPYEAGKRVLDPKFESKLKCSKSSLDQFKSKSLSDTFHNVPLESLNGLPDAPNCVFDFDNSNIKVEDFSFLLNSRRNGSSPGINGIPYKVYKKCPKIMSFLFKIFLSCAKLCLVPVQWRIASEVYIPKVNQPNVNKIEDFRPIALLNVEGKLFFSLISKRMEKHIIHKNQFINTSIQKGCMEKVPGCWEHMSSVWDELKDNKLNKTSISAVWLDIANAYGSVTHQLIFLALERYGVHPHWINIIKSYYGGLWSRSFSSDSPSSWHQHLRGIFTGCTASIILFLAAINVIIEFICADLEKPVKTSSKPVKAFMDDLFLKGNTLEETQNLLDRANVSLSWARMKLKPSKSKSLIITDGKVNQHQFLSINVDNKNVLIPSIVNNPVKFLGRMIDFSLKDTTQVQTFCLAVSRGLSLIDKSSHRGVHKIWILHHLLIPRLRWPLLIYEIPLTIVIRQEQKISCFIRKWLNLRNSTTNICLYSSVSPCPLPLKSLSSVWKSAKVSGHLLLRDSADKCISDSDINLKCGSWEVANEVIKAEEMLKFKEIMGYHQTNRAGLGSFSTPEVPPKRSHEYRKLISSLIEESDENRFEAKAVQLSMQGNWVKWCNFVRFDLSWNTLLALPQSLISFCINATYDTLPSPSNLHRWSISTEKSCYLCNKTICTTAHVLGGCKVALEQGRFTYRHDSVLSVIVKFLKQFLSSYKVVSNKDQKIKFVKAGTKNSKKIKSSFSGLLNLAPDWVILDDLNGNLIVPPFMAITRLRPDLLLYSSSTKTCIILELTCCCEENFEQWHEKKFFKYDPLSNLISSNGWKVYLFPIEIGARGYCSTSLKSCFHRLGFSGKFIRSMMKSLSITSMKSSFYIWQSRDSKSWSNPLPSTTNENNISESHKTSHEMLKSAQGKVTINDHSVTYNEQVKKKVVRSAIVGLINKGNTCYINSCLQCLRTMPGFWSNLSSTPENQTPFVSSFLKIMSLLKTAKAAIDPSPFLRFLKQVLMKMGRTDFDLFQQQDAGEILSCVLNELCSESVQSSDSIKLHVKNTVCCNLCLQSSITEDPLMILQLSVSSSIQNSIDLFLKPEELTENNLYFCNICASHQEAALEHEFTRLGDFLIIQLKRFVNFSTFVTKDSKSVFCNPLIKVPVVVDNEIITQKPYKLIGTVNHSGDLNRGHYTAHILDPDLSVWIHCNDAAVVPSSKKPPDNLCYILFYRAC